MVKKNIWESPGKVFNLIIKFKENLLFFNFYAYKVADTVNKSRVTVLQTFLLMIHSTERRQ